MRRFSVLLGAVATAVGLIALPAAVAANPEVNHFRDSGTFTDTDFCGTGKTIEGSFAVHGTEFLAPNQAVDYWQAVEGDVVFTNPRNGSKVFEHFANTFSDTIVSGVEEGLHVHEFSYKGLPELLRTARGAVLLRDAGYLVFRDTFDGDEFVSGEIVLNRGPHPDAESDFALFCEVMTSALGVS